ncbi:hypothetical protein DIURU_001079 [Diutina rugosa]|uniref:TPR-like protein n=1 Tax=Diutina rugosa TaxID=5481 RepID=A0A642UVE7_DIURU|nr:uncharacterized protein DIURU_001079 [Diutina rugosa]KAA8906341.1 hypothetical protein DIURU_001079 [Diutina rugosa]
MALRTLLTQLLLGVLPAKFEATDDEKFTSLVGPIKKIISGEADVLIGSDELQALIKHNTNIDEVVNQTLTQMVDKFGPELGPIQMQVLAICALQLFVQANYTGPELVNGAAQTLGLSDDAAMVKLLSIEGQPAYDLMIEPGYLLFALRTFEKLMGANADWHLQSFEEIKETASQYIRGSEGNPVQASLQWWRTRALQVHMMVIAEPADVIGTLCQVLLTPSVATALAPAAETDPQVVSAVQQLYLLEAIRINIHGNTEHLAEPLLKELTRVSQLQLVLTGAKAKRTKFQTYLASSLVVLAKSCSPSIYEDDQGADEAPVNLDLESDLLLEKPHFESLENVEFTDDDTPAAKRLKYDVEDSEQSRIVPIALSSDKIPAELQSLDLNNQPRLNDLDSIQLISRLIILAQTSPSGDPLIEEELMAIVSRIIYADNADKKPNPTVFGRALWQRSVLETQKPKTIERGILQMTALVEEAGIKVKTRVFAEEQVTATDVAHRLRFIHQLPLLSSWAMNGELAKRYMSFGAFKSAIDIYERLGMVHDAAVCYAATDDVARGIEIIKGRLATHPEDARAIAILGDFTMDPELWERSWQVGKYAKAKASLARYWYSPPSDSGHQRNVDLSIKHMNQCLTVNPLNFENWYFYGCCGLESGQFELAAEAFSRCVALDDTNAQAWSNLASALLQLEDKLKPAFQALKRAARLGYETKSWKIFENYLTVALKLQEWQEVVFSAGRLLKMRANDGEAAVDTAVFEELSTVLCSTDYPSDANQLSHFQRAAIDLICQELPKVITHNPHLWRIVAKVEAWRKRPWAALEAYEKAARVVTLRPEVEYETAVWNEAVDAVSDLVAAYENYGDLPGRHGGDDVVCANWKYKAKQVVRSLTSRGKSSFEGDDGWERLMQLKADLV